MSEPGEDKEQQPTEHAMVAAGALMSLREGRSFPPLRRVTSADWTNDLGEDPLALDVELTNNFFDTVDVEPMEIAYGEEMGIFDDASEVNIEPAITPTDEDVLLGRGGKCNKHAGNKRFRDMVQALKPEYRGAKRARKAQLSQSIVEDVSNRGGRFLVANMRTGTWCLADPRRARRKVSQALRDMTTLERFCGKIERMSFLGGDGMPKPLNEAGMRNWYRFESVVRKAQKLSLQEGEKKKKTSSSEPFRPLRMYKKDSLQDSFHILHATINLGLPSTIILHTLRMYPQQLRQRDKHGHLPLHAAASQRGADSARSVFKKLLSNEFGYPDAASIPDPKGRLPLHLATEAGWGHETGLLDVLKAAPSALQTRDVETHLYPFMMAAVGDVNSLNTVYCLLLECPTLVITNVKECEQTTRLLKTTTHATAEKEAKQRKEKFLMFVRVLVKYLEKKDLAMHTQTKAVIKECAKRHKSGDVAYASLASSIQTRLRQTVGEVYWNKAEDYLNHFLKQKLKQATEKQQQLEEEEV